MGRVMMLSMGLVMIIALGVVTLTGMVVMLITCMVVGMWLSVQSNQHDNVCGMSLTRN